MNRNLGLGGSSPKCGWKCGWAGPWGPWGKPEAGWKGCGGIGWWDGGPGGGGAPTTVGRPPLGTEVTPEAGLELVTDVGIEVTELFVEADEAKASWCWAAWA